MQSETPLPRWFTDLLAHRRWVRRTRPFAHVYVRDVFEPRFYARLAAEYEQVRAERPQLFGKVANNYGASGVSLSELRDGPLEVFVSRAWHDLIAGVVGVTDVTGDVEGSVHHHPPDSPRGWPHSDLAPAWFGSRAPAKEAIALPDPAVDLKKGTRAAGVEARELVRAVAVLFYFGNPDWQPGDGGETGLYSAIGGPNPEPAIFVPPLNNSMIVFECTPRSWHAFAGGNTAVRNSVVMWLHQPRELAVRRWGGAGIAEW
ncbi:2OG-Fe(II) oxygenase [Nocardia macrotermitis]|uniref:Prolyl 3,4-dihydroxylase TPA1/OFD1 N-terminal domain-containing protein n=1 Tax=Nocardia macrotermitis TaxID=2585198 RepID=A0A7K0DFB5_9NOCA|nr:2OG-Fe(II) oxygenase [Nocardia macrotermitis]MQY23982.1 hypothetical protein [Nocardia macrotermitis]